MPDAHSPAASTLRRALARLAVVLVALVALVVSTAVLAPASDAMTRHTRHHLMHVAASKKGTPYRYGATGPRAFDCSGYTRWVFAKVGRHLPRTSRQQAWATHRIRRSHRHRGDLVFFHDHGGVYHVGIYAGHDRLWHAPRPGKRVGREHIWSSHVTYGRVR